MSASSDTILGRKKNRERFATKGFIRVACYSYRNGVRYADHSDAKGRTSRSVRYRVRVRRRVNPST